MRRLLTAALLSFSIGLPAQQPAKRPMTFADLMAMKRVGDPQVSPSGKWVMFSVTEVSLEKNSKVNHLWVVPLAGGEERPITSGTNQTNGRFSPDGKWVMYTSDEGGSSQIWIAPWDEAAGKIGTGHAVTKLETEADGAIWAPDSRHFVFTSEVWPDCESKAPMGTQHNQEEADCNVRKDAEKAKDPVKAQVFTSLLYRHWDSYQGDKRSHIFYGDTEDGAPEDLTPASVIGDHVAPTFSLGGPLGYAIAPDGQEIAYVVNLDKVPAESTNNDIYVLKVGAEPATAKKVSTAAGSDDGPQYSPDGKWLAWRSQRRNGYESDKFDLVVMDRATGKALRTMPNFDRWIDEYRWGAKSDAIYFTASDQGGEAIFSFSFEGGVWPISPEHTYLPYDTPPSGEYGELTISHDGRFLVATKATINEPAEVYKFDLRQAITSWEGLPPPPQIGLKMRPGSIEMIESHFPVLKREALTHINTEKISSLVMLPLEPFWFAGANGTKVQGFIVKPPNFDPSKKYPVKFLIHGGPQGAWGDAWSYRWNPELFAADGYVVVMVNPRGSTGYGQKFLEQVSGDWGGRPFEDLMRGLDYAEQHYSFIDKDRECALGASYGGYMADWVLTHTDRFKCIVTHDGMSDPAAAFGTTEELWFPEWEFRSLASSAPDAVVEQEKPSHPWDFYGKPETENPYIKWSPMRFIKNAKTPTLVIHGQRDYRLDVSQGFELFTALQLLGVPSKMLYFPDEGHWVLKPQNSQLWYETVNDWCDQWTHSGKYAGQRSEDAKVGR